MATGVDIKLKGFDRLTTILERGGDAVLNEVDANMEDAAKVFVRNAKSKAPTDQGDIVRGITYDKLSLLRYKITAGARHSGYLEFGTGSRFRSIPGFEDVAASIRGKTGQSYQQGLDNIKAWVKRKGIRIGNLSIESTVFLIFRSILRNGINAQPYFLQNVEPARLQMEKSVKDIEKAFK